MVLGGLSIKVNNDKNEFHFVYQIKQKMTDNESNPTEMNNNCGQINPPDGNIVSYDLKHLSDSGDVVSRIDKFICYSDTTFTLNMTNIEQQNKTICLFINCRKLQIYSLDSFKFQHSKCDLRLLMFTIMQDYK